MSSLYNESNKTYNIRSSQNSLRAPRFDLTPRPIISERPKSQTFNYDNYFESKLDKSKLFQLPPVSQALKPEPKPISSFNVNLENNDKGMQAKVKQVKQRSAVQMVNDLTHLCTNVDHKANVHFHFYNDDDDDNYNDDLIISIHSLILFVRSTWFRRSWRMSSDNSDSALKEKYNFVFSSKNICDEKLEISFLNKLPDNANGEYHFNVCIGDSKRNIELYDAFKQFKKFLYCGDCEIHGGNSMYLTILSEAFEIDSLKGFLSIYFQGTINCQNIDHLLKIVQLAYIYKIDDLKFACIDIINKNSMLIINSFSWQKLTKDHPKLVLEIFEKN